MASSRPSSSSFHHTNQPGQRAMMCLPPRHSKPADYIFSSCCHPRSEARAFNQLLHAEAHRLPCIVVHVHCWDNEMHISNASPAVRYIKDTREAATVPWCVIHSCCDSKWLDSSQCHSAWNCTMQKNVNMVAMIILHATRGGSGARRELFFPDLLGSLTRELQGLLFWDPVGALLIQGVQNY